MAMAKTRQIQLRYAAVVFSRIPSQCRRGVAMGMNSFESVIPTLGSALVIVSQIGLLTWPMPWLLDCHVAIYLASLHPLLVPLMNR